MVEETQTPDVTETVTTPEVSETPETQTVENQTPKEVENDDTLLDTVGKEKADTEVEYDFTVPEGMQLDKQMLDAFLPVFKELDISKETAQKLIDTYAPITQAKEAEFQKTQMKAFQDLIEGWKEQTIKQLGSDSQKTLSLAAKSRDAFGDEEFNQMLRDTGVGNHPAMVRFLINVGKATSEDSFPDGETKGKPDTLDVLYPTMKK